MAKSRRRHKVQCLSFLIHKGKNRGFVCLQRKLPDVTRCFQLPEIIFIKWNVREAKFLLVKNHAVFRTWGAQNWAKVCEDSQSFRSRSSQRCCSGATCFNFLKTLHLSLIRLHQLCQWDLTYNAVFSLLPRSFNSHSHLFSGALNDTHVSFVEQQPTGDHESVNDIMATQSL